MPPSGKKVLTLGWLDKLGLFLSLTLCNLANFDQQNLSKCSVLH